MPRQSVRSNSALAALLYLGGCLADPDQCPNVKQQRPKYWLANRVVCTAWLYRGYAAAHLAATDARVQSDQLSHVKDAFARLGYEQAESAEDDWTVLWAFHSPFHQREGEPDVPALVDKMKPHQMRRSDLTLHAATTTAGAMQLNQLPAASAFASKTRLARASGHLPFLPRSFVLPDESENFRQYAADHPDAEWLVKGSKHRGVSILTNVEDAIIRSQLDPALKEDVFVQQLIRPYLIDEKLWDVGVYVAVTSVNPLRVYVYDNLLLRHCAEPYQEDLAKAPAEAYVVAEDYAPPWAIGALRPYYTRGYSTANVLRAYMHDHGVDFEEILTSMKEMIVKALLHFEPELRSEALSFYPHGSRSFFSMYRFDFLLDRALQPWLIEVNQSPNLSSESTEDLKNMFQRISFSLLHLMGFGFGQLRHPHNAADHKEIIGHHNDVDIGWRVCSRCTPVGNATGDDDECAGECNICRRCRTPEQTRMIQELISEQRNRQGFMRLFPLNERMRQRPGMQDVYSPTLNDALLRTWIDERCKTDRSWC